MKKANESGEVMPLDMAYDEVNKWLDGKNYPVRKREKNQESIDTLAEAIADGALVLNEDGTLTQNLLNPLENGEGVVTLSELTFKKRISYEQVEGYMKGVKASDSFGMVNAYVSALTGKGQSIIKKTDTGDLTLSQTIASFFL